MYNPYKIKKRDVDKEAMRIFDDFKEDVKNFYLAKVCSLKLVDKIIAERLSIKNPSNDYNSERLEFWNMVKKTIEKL